MSLLVILDGPNPSSLARDREAGLLNLIRYYFWRGKRLGPRKSYAYLCDHVRKHLPRQPSRKPNEVVEEAVLAYRPRHFEGPVLLLLATEHPPRPSYVAGWKAVVAQDLTVAEIHAHHRELLRADSVRKMAHLIRAHLQED